MLREFTAHIFVLINHDISMNSKSSIYNSEGDSSKSGDSAAASPLGNTSSCSYDISYQLKVYKSNIRSIYNKYNPLI